MFLDGQHSTDSGISQAPSTERKSSGSFLASSSSSGDGASIKELNLSQNRYINDFKEFERIGSGGFGAVFRCLSEMDDTDYAIKKVPVSSEASWRPRLQKVREEVKILARLNHRHVVRYFGAWMEKMEHVQYSPNPMGGGDDDSISMSFSAMQSECCTEMSMSALSLDRTCPVSKNPRPKTQYDVFLFIQMEYCPFGTLRDFLIKKTRTVNVMAMLKILKQIAVIVPPPDDVDVNGDDDDYGI